MVQNLHHKKSLPKKILPGSKMQREDIVDAVINPDSVIILGDKVSKKNIAIPTSASIRGGFEELIREMDVVPGSLMYQVTKEFYEIKKTSIVDTRVLIVRIRNLNDEQLKIVRLLCRRKDFRASNILRFIQFIRRFNDSYLLTLRAFLDLEGVNPGVLNQFFSMALPQGNRNELGDSAYEKEVAEKAMTLGQCHAYYNIIHHIDGILPSDAITILRLSRKIKFQHTRMINRFQRKETIYGGKPIRRDHALNLVKLWLIMPQMDSEKRFEHFIKRIVKKFKKKSDLLFVIESYKGEILMERTRKGRLISFLLRLFG